MSLEFVTDPVILNEAREKIRLAFLSRGIHPISNKIGWRGGSTSSEVYWDTETEIWFSAKGDAEGHYWNAFGVDNPAKYKMLSIHCEINFPFSGINRRLAGAVARTLDGALVLTHNGGIGGGAKGIGQDLFWTQYSRLADAIIDGSAKRSVAVVGILDSPSFLDQLSSFVHEVVRIKEFQTSTTTSSSQRQDFAEFKKEYEGVKTYLLQKEIRSDHKHATITKSLVNELKEIGHRFIANNQKTDVFLYRGEQMTTMFEVKPDSSTTSVYCAVGQLLFHGADANPRPRLVFVAPDSLSHDQRRRIKKLGVELLLFRWDSNKVVFQDIEQQKY